MAIESERVRETAGEETDEVEEEVERFLALEADVREAYEESDREADARLDLRPGHIRGGFGRNIRSASVISAEEREREIHLRFQHPDGEGVAESRFPFPDDPADMHEPLARLCHWDGTPADRVAELDSVPVVGQGDDVRVFVPPPRTIRAVDVVLPVAGVRRLTFEGPLSRGRRMLRLLQRGILATPTVKGHPGDYDATLKRALAALLLLPVAAFVVAGLIGGGGAALVAYTVAFVLVYVGTFDLAFEDPFDTY